MNAQIDQLLDECLALEPAERSALAIALLDSVDGDDVNAVTKAWLEEIRQRREQLRSGAVQAAPWAQARARLSAL